MVILFHLILLFEEKRILNRNVFNVSRKEIKAKEESIETSTAPVAWQ